MNTHRFPIGHKYVSRGKYPHVCTVSEQLTVTNSRGDVVRRYYQATHLLLGQVVTENEVCDTTIAMGTQILVDKAPGSTDR